MATPSVQREIAVEIYACDQGGSEGEPINAIVNSPTDVLKVVYEALAAGKLDETGVVLVELHRLPAKRLKPLTAKVADEILRLPCLHDEVREVVRENLPDLDDPSVADIYGIGEHLEAWWAKTLAEATEQDGGGSRELMVWHEAITAEITEIACHLVDWRSLAAGYVALERAREPFPDCTDRECGCAQLAVVA